MSQGLWAYQPRATRGHADRAQQAALAKELVSRVDVLAQAPVAATPAHLVALNGAVQVIGAVAREERVALTHRRKRVGVATPNNRQAELVGGLPGGRVALALRPDHARVETLDGVEPPARPVETVAPKRWHTAVERMRGNGEAALSVDGGDRFRCGATGR